MFQEGFDPMTPMFDRAKTVHALDRADTVIGSMRLLSMLNAKVKFALYLIKHHTVMTDGDMEIQIHAFLVLALDGCKW
jgi:hypothetical protein